MMITEEELSDEEMDRQDLYRNIKTINDLIDECEYRAIVITRDDIIKECDDYADWYRSLFDERNQDFHVRSIVDMYATSFYSQHLLHYYIGYDGDFLTFNGESYDISDDICIDLSSELLQHLINQFIYVDVQDDEEEY